MVRIMTIEDYDGGICPLVKKIKGFGIRSIDDSKRRSGALFETKPDDKCRGRKKTVALSEVFCAVTTEDWGCLYHVCVDEDYRRHGIGKKDG